MKQMIYILINICWRVVVENWKNHSNWYPPPWRENTWFFQWHSSFFWISFFQIKEFLLSPFPSWGQAGKASMCNQNVPLIGGVNLIGLSFLLIIFWLSFFELLPITSLILNHLELLLRLTERMLNTCWIKHRNW